MRCTIRGPEDFSKIFATNSRELFSLCVRIIARLMERQPQMFTQEPKTKEDILDRMTRIDFSGDLRQLGESVQLHRLKRHVLQLYFPKTGKKFNLTVHKPRPEGKKKIAAQRPNDQPAPAPKAKRKRRSRVSH
jgi:hypothetical protein